MDGVVESHVVRVERTAVNGTITEVHPDFFLLTRSVVETRLEHEYSQLSIGELTEVDMPGAALVLTERDEFSNVLNAGRDHNGLMSLALRRHRYHFHHRFRIIREGVRGHQGLSALKRRQNNDALQACTGACKDVLGEIAVIEIGDEYLRYANIRIIHVMRKLTLYLLAETLTDDQPASLSVMLGGIAE